MSPETSCPPPDKKPAPGWVHHELVITALLSRLRALACTAASAVAASAPLTELPLVAASVEVVANGAVKKRILLLPMGQVALRDGRGPFQLDNLAHAQEVIAATLEWAGKTDLMIDYDHQSLHAATPQVGGRAIAAGWITALEADDAGIWANVDWTAAAAAALEAREYRYVSPLFYHFKNNKVQRLVNAGLVNIPAITDLPAVAAQASSLQPQENLVDFKKIAAALGLPETATEDEILAALAGMAVMPQPEMVAAAAALGLANTASLTEIVAAAAAAAPDPAKFMPMEAFTPLQAQLATLNGERVDRLVAASVAEGKLTPAQTAWAKSYALKDEAGFNSWLAGAPVIVAAGSVIEGEIVATASALTETEQTVARTFGLTAAEFSAAKKGQ